MSETIGKSKRSQESQKDGCQEETVTDRLSETATVPEKDSDSQPLI